MPPIVCSVENAFLLVFVVVLVSIVVEPAIGRVRIRVIGTLQRITVVSEENDTLYTSANNLNVHVGGKLEVVRSLIHPDRFKRDVKYSRSRLDLTPGMQKCLYGLPYAVKSLTQETDMNRGMILVRVVAGYVCAVDRKGRVVGGRAWVQHPDRARKRRNLVHVELVVIFSFLAFFFGGQSPRQGQD